MIDLSPRQTDLARHALGISDVRSRGGWKRTYRNRFFAGYGSPDWWQWMLMVRKGAAKWQPSRGGMFPDDFFWLNREGAEAVLKPRERLCPEDFPAALTAQEQG